MVLAFGEFKSDTKTNTLARELGGFELRGSTYTQFLLFFFFFVCIKFYCCPLVRGLEEGSAVVQRQARAEARHPGCRGSLGGRPAPEALRRD